MRYSYFFKLTGVLLVVSLLGLSSGCGQTGPLYLPDDAPDKDKPAKQKR